MEIRILQGHSPNVDDGEFANVIIDVIRAFTCSHLAFMGGAKQVVLVSSVAEALKYRQQHPDVLLAGEVDGLPIDGFDLSNSPVQFAKSDLRGRGLVQRTTNGVQAALSAMRAEHPLVTGFTCADATVLYLQKKIAEAQKEVRINLIASHPTSDEDVACAEYMRGQLLGTGLPSASEVGRRIRNAEAAKKFFDPAQSAFDPLDIEYCTRRYAPEFVMRIVTVDKDPMVERVDV